MNVVTGAFGFSGRHIAQHLLARGEPVRTLTNHARTGVLPSSVEIAPLNFGDKNQLAHSLEGTTVLYNTYWVRFAYGSETHDVAVENSKLLLQAAVRAGVKRIVHVSITNPDPKSQSPYFRGKALVEDAIRSSGLSYAILRPAVLFGPGDILLNNIAWLLRKFPVFAVPGKGDYRLQPIFVEDLADLAVESGHSEGDVVKDAVGPEVFTYDELVQLIRKAVGSRSLIAHWPPRLVIAAGKCLNWMVHDEVLTEREVYELMSDVLFSREAPTGRTSFSGWLSERAGSFGCEYASELDRHYRK